MLPAGFQLWRLSADSKLGLCCNPDGLFLGRTPLIEHRAGCYIARPRSELERLFKGSSAGADLDRLSRGLSVVKSALDARLLDGPSLSQPMDAITLEKAVAFFSASRLLGGIKAGFRDGVGKRRA